MKKSNDSIMRYIAEDKSRLKLFEYYVDDLEIRSSHLHEATAKDLVYQATPRVAARVSAQNLRITYLGVDADGYIHFKCTSGTVPGRFWYQVIKLFDLDAALELQRDSNSSDEYDSRIAPSPFDGRDIDPYNTEDDNNVGIDRSLDQETYYQDTQSQTQSSKRDTASQEITDSEVINLALFGDIGVYCFTADNKVLMSDGSYKNINDVKIGDSVISHLGLSRLVVKTHKRDVNEFITNIYTSNSKEPIRATSNHKLLALKSIEDYYNNVSPDWVPVKDIKVGNILLAPKRIYEELSTHNICKYYNPVKVNKKNYSEHNGTVYNLEVEGEHTYTVNNVAVHNCNDYSFLYYGWQYLGWVSGYGLKRELRRPTRNNIRLEGSVCFTAGTLVKTPPGYENIENLNIGDIVVSHKGNHCKVENIGIRTPDTLLEVIIDDEVFKVTPDHPFLTFVDGYNKKFVPIRLLKVDDVVLSTSVKSNSLNSSEYYVRKIQSIKEIEPEEVYSITVSKDHSYLVGKSNIAVHNCKHLVAVLRAFPFYINSIVKDMRQRGIM